MKVGIIGAGQLGRMLALAGYPLGLSFVVLDPTPQSSAGQVAEQIVAHYTDRSALGLLASKVDVVTYEFENVPVDSVHFIAEKVPVFPRVNALEMAQDRLTEKTFFQNLQIPIPRFAPVHSLEELRSAIHIMGSPAVLKTRRFGYDGKGQCIIRQADDSEIESAWRALSGYPLILEQFIAFDRELSILAVRSQEGNIGFYPLVENHHKEGILRFSLAPAHRVAPDLQARAEEYATSVLQALDYVGVLAIELFETGGHLLANEMAPRVHNSGHWTIEGAETSQFENHLRAVVGLPLGATSPIGISAMVNLLGTVPDPALLLSVPGTHLHLYAKPPAPMRKLGHVTVRTQNEEDTQQALGRLQTVLNPVPLTPGLFPLTPPLAGEGARR